MPRFTSQINNFFDDSAKQTIYPILSLKATNFKLKILLSCYKIVQASLTNKSLISFRILVHFHVDAKYVSADTSQGFNQLLIA